jgi:hypothetical protein
MILCLKNRANFISEIVNEDLEIVEHNIKFNVYSHITYDDYKDILNILMDKQISRWQVEDKENS